MVQDWTEACQASIHGQIFASIFVGWLIANLRVVFMCFNCSLWSRFMLWLDGFDLWVGNMGFIHQLEPVLVLKEFVLWIRDLGCVCGLH